MCFQSFKQEFYLPPSFVNGCYFGCCHFKIIGYKNKSPVFLIIEKGYLPDPYFQGFIIVWVSQNNSLISQYSIQTALFAYFLFTYFPIKPWIVKTAHPGYSLGCPRLKLTETSITLVK